MRLTETIVETALYEGSSYMSKAGRKRWRRHVLWDDSLPGFGLQITSTNRKSYIVAFQDGGRKRTRRLGSADSLGLDEARQQAAELLASVADEPAPSAAERPRVKGVETVAQLADAYLEGHLKGTNPSWYADQRLMQFHIKPALGRSPLVEVTQTDLASLGNRVARRFPADARRLKPLLAGMFDWAAERGLWGKGARRADGEQPSPSPAPAPEAAAEPEPLPTPEELAESLRASESQRRELASRLEEISASGLDMLAKLNQQAATQKELEKSLANSQRELKRSRAQAAELPDPKKAKRETANLRQSVEQLMASLDKAESRYTETAEKLATTEARAAEQAKSLAALTRSRNDLEDRLRETERRAALQRAQERRDHGGWRRFALGLAAGAVAGVVLTLLIESALRPAASPATSTPAAEPERSSVAEPPPSAPDPDRGARVADPAKPEPVASAAPSEPSGPELGAVEAAVQSWATAWSEQRVDDYLAAYSARFEPPGGLGRGEWASQRRNRILRPASIRVTLRSLTRTVVDANRVRVSFQQSYQTPTYADEVRKTLELAWEDGGWRIVAESAS